MLKIIKRSALSAIHAAGLFTRIAESPWRQSRLSILCYHGISLADEHEWDQAFYMSPAAFERRMALLDRGGYRVLPLGEALEMLGAGALPPKSIALTFDDGMSDFYHRAYLILKKYGFPATVYLTTYYCHHNLPVFPVFVNYLLWTARDRAVGPNARLGLERRTDLNTPEGRHRAWSEITGFAKRNHLSAGAKDELARELAGELGISYADLARRRILHIMRPEEVSELAAAGVDFELHTHRHRTPYQRDLFAREIEDNRKAIQDLTGKPTRHFCYPSGDYHEDSFSWLLDLGVKSATTCNPGIATRDFHPMVIPRFIDSTSLSLLEFESLLSGASEFLPRRRSSARRSANGTK